MKNLKTFKEVNETQTGKIGRGVGSGKDVQTGETDLKALAVYLYEESFDKLKEYWDIARDGDDPDAVVDKIETVLDNETKKVKGFLKKIGKTWDELWDGYEDNKKMSLRDYLWEFVDAGIN